MTTKLGTKKTRRLNEPQIPFVFTVVLVPGNEKWREILLTSWLQVPAALAVTATVTR